MQVGEQNLPFAQQTVLGFQRLLDLHDHLSLTENFLSRVDNLRTDCDVALVRETTARARAFLHQNGVAAARESGRGGRKQADAMFLLFDFLRDADDHPPALAEVSAAR